MPAKKAAIRYVCVGYIQKPHALKGEVKAVLHYPLSEKKKIKTLYIGDGNPLPCEVEQLHPIGKNTYIMKTADCNDRNRAEEITGQKIHVRDDDFDEYFMTDEIVGLIGYKAVADGKLLGTIEDIFNLPQQHLAQVIIEGKEILIPLNGETISEVDKKKKTLYLTLPDGLLEAQ